MEKMVIGRTEYVALPDLGFFDIEAKIDTGAYSCSIHCDDIRLNDDGTVHFMLLDDTHPDYSQQHIVMPVYEIRNVKSSNGTIQERIFVKTPIEIYGVKYEIELSLTDRKKMKFPMLIGRKFLENRFIVDVSLTHQSTHS